MRPVLFQLGGLDVNSYGVSKALAALVAGYMLAKELRRHRLDPGLAYGLTLAATIAGFVGAKLYYVAEHADHLTLHDVGGMGFTWFGGLIAGAAAVIVVARHHRIPIGLMSAMAAAPLAVAYGVGRLGCLLAGDGTYGVHSNLPWAMSFPHGTVPTSDRVHPTPLYEALGAFVVGALLWRLRTRVKPPVLFALFAVLQGASRFLVEFIRPNEKVVLGLSQPQLWSLALVAVGLGIAYRTASAGKAVLLPETGAA